MTPNMMATIILHHKSSIKFSERKNKTRHITNVNIEETFVITLPISLSKLPIGDMLHYY
jgi:hypothetical protein